MCRISKNVYWGPFSHRLLSRARACPSSNRGRKGAWPGINFPASEADLHCFRWNRLKEVLIEIWSKRDKPEFLRVFCFYQELLDLWRHQFFKVGIGLNVIKGQSDKTSDSGQIYSSGSREEALKRDLKRATSKWSKIADLKVFTLSSSSNQEALKRK